MTAPSPAAPPYARYAAALRRLPPADRSAPLGLLDLDAFRANAAALHARAGGLPVRVASKSLRVRRAVEEALTRPGYRGVLAYALPEALWWVELGQEDVLVAYPSVDEEALARWVVDPAARAAVTVAVDSPDHLAVIEAVARRAGVPLDDDAGRPPLRVCLDVDAAWEPHRLLRVGALRSPVRTPEQAAAMARRITGTPGLRLAGVLAYEGQVAGVPEGSGPRSAVVRGIKRTSMRELAARRPAIVAAVRAVAHEAGADLEFVNGGGTGSADLTAQDPSVTEIGAGSGLMGPASFDGFRGLDLRPASFFTRPVVRRPRPGVVTVAGGGWVASGMPGADRLPVVAWPEGLRYSGQEAAGEVQTPLRGTAADRLSLGDPVFFRHAKAGEPAEHLAAVAVYAAEQDAIVDLWPTYRGEGRVFG
ncbi:alanine racemase [Micrococcus sp.]|uniref:alanine racemase n=1 Tax=Micrococcus sp. TaxID=1271 RepID=UPI0026DBEA30|nr:alanine racemase [Micrococcus sp.]MDO4239264.1 alanine racemase [Micrococcus sp.]